MASNSNVKLPPGLAHGISTSRLFRIVTFDLRHSGCQIGIMVKKVQMPPALFLGICLPTLRAGKGTSSGKIDPDVKSLCIGVKLRIRHLPGRCQTKSHLKNVYVSHNENRNTIFAVGKSRLTHLKQRGTFFS